MNKRLQLLEQMTASGQADAFTWYGLAMEYRKLGQADAALKAFETLRAQYADYLPQYLMAGQLLSELSLTVPAREWLEAGIALARARGDSKTLGELDSALAELA
jgi:hypothetical protein